VKLVSHPKKRTEIENIRGQGAEERIRKLERESNVRLEKRTESGD
jgi:chromosome segregation and condensation protein ScpB